MSRSGKRSVRAVAAILESLRENRERIEELAHESRLSLTTRTALSRAGALVNDAILKLAFDVRLEVDE